MTKFKKKFRIESARLQNWDYGWNALYYITICTQHRKHYFGEIENDEMILSEIGKMAENFWYEIPEHFPFVVLDAFVLMPNHIHGIIVIDKNSDENNGCCHANVETQNLASLEAEQSQRKNKFGPQSKNLASIIRGYKIGVTKYARQHNINFAWQPRFHDHIIRNKQSYKKIKNYIIKNPQKWHNDILNDAATQT